MQRSIVFLATTSANRQRVKLSLCRCTAWPPYILHGGFFGL